MFDIDNIKTTPMTMASSTKPTNAAVTKQAPIMVMPTEKQKKEIEMVQKRHQINAELAMK